MKPIADEIHKDGLKAGIWLAPFGAEFNSNVAKQHSDWLIKDEKGKPIPVGANWGGFYGIDFIKKMRRSIYEIALTQYLTTGDLIWLNLTFSMPVP